MKTVITYGTYDLLHHGHIRLLERAKLLGDYLIVGVTSDYFDRQRGKLNVQQTLSERIEAVRQTGLADLIIAEEYEGQKIADIQKYHADIFTVGSDWLGRFDYLKKYCEVIYLDRTTGISSTELRAKEYEILKLGCIGMNVPTERFLTECKFVSGVEITACFFDRNTPNRSVLEELIRNDNITNYETAEDMLRHVDAVYIAASRNHNHAYIKQALECGKHVICESPMFLNRGAAKELMTLAQKRKLVLMEAVKTLYFPAFQQLLLLIGSRVIGDVVHVDVSCSQSSPLLDKNNIYEGSMYDFGVYVLLPIFKILGNGFKKCSMKNIYDENSDFCKLTSGYLEYLDAAATFKAGKGIKTEGELIITGTEGYIYVPAPWWKMEYFEIRYEDLRNTKKYFCKCEGEGLRYEIEEFLKRIHGFANNNGWGRDDILAANKVMELFQKDHIS